MTPGWSPVMRARPPPAHGHTTGRTGGPERRVHHTTGSAPAGHRNRRKTGRCPPGTRRTADTSPPDIYTPARPTPATAQSSDADLPAAQPPAQNQAICTRLTARPECRSARVFGDQDFTGGARDSRCVASTRPGQRQQRAVLLKQLIDSQRSEGEHGATPRDRLVRRPGTWRYSPAANGSRSPRPQPILASPAGEMPATRCPVRAAVSSVPRGLHRRPDPP